MPQKRCAAREGGGNHRLAQYRQAGLVKPEHVALDSIHQMIVAAGATD